METKTKTKKGMVANLKKKKGAAEKKMLTWKRKIKTEIGIVANLKKQKGVA